MTHGRLRFDSARVRTAPAVRTLLFEVGDVAVDVLLLDRAAGVRIVHGQVMHASGTAVAGVWVRAGEEFVCTDQHGQFSVTLERGQAGHLVVDAPDGKIACAFPREDAVPA